MHCTVEKLIRKSVIVFIMGYLIALQKENQCTEY